MKHWIVLTMEVMVVESIVNDGYFQKAKDYYKELNLD
jgi:hypothetical protein